MSTWRALGIVATLTVVGASCSSGSAAGPGTTAAESTQSTEQTSTALNASLASEPAGPYERFGDCDAFLAWTKQQLLDRVTPWGIDPYGWDPNAAMERSFPASDESAATEAPADSAAPAANEAADRQAPAPAGGTSTTNTQEVGVDESDVSETDGRFVYSIIDSTLRSVDLKTSTVVYEEQLPDDLLGHPEVILFESTLLIHASSSSNNSSETVLHTYSVVDGVPAFTGATHLEGSTISVRSVDGVARITTTTSLLPRISFVQPGYNGGGSDTPIELNRGIINDLTVDDLLPRRYSVAADGTRGNVEQALDCDRVGHPGEFAGFGLTWVASLDLRDPSAEPIGSGGIVADSQTVYVSTDHLYIAGQTGLWPRIVDGVALAQNSDPATAIHSFGLTDPANTDYLASGTVPGTLLNSYSMSEFDGHLRVATTESSSGFGGGQDSGIHIFAEQGSDLIEVGAVRGLGQGEEIQAVRYDGPRAYVVTFRQTDPLFVLDLTDPTAPTLSGELKIPGYSSYLHPIGDGLVLGVGFSGTIDGLTSGTQLSLFDVSDPSNPTQLATAVLNRVTEAAFDPHAFLWWPETSDVIVPKDMLCEFGQLDECATAVVVHVDVANRTMTETARLFQWFPVRRSMVANGDLLTLSAGGLKQWSFADFSELADIRFDIPGTTAEDDLP
jgi:hypothetical protein